MTNFSSAGRSGSRHRLLCICYEFPPQTTPTAIRTGKLLGRLAADGWQLDIVTAAADAALAGISAGDAAVTFRYVPQPSPSRWHGQLARLRLSKLVELVDWLDDKRSWAAPALAAAMELSSTHRPDAVAVFMMPYTSGLVGLELKRQTGVPVVMNFDDSPTCSDMHPSFPTKWHFRRAVAFEDTVVQVSDAIIYVSQRNLDRVRDRQPAEHRGKFHLIRYGADPADFVGDPPSRAEDGIFRIVYIGGMTGWHAFDPPDPHPLVRLAKRVLATWNRLGRYTLVELDHRGSSPVFVARAAQQVMRDEPAFAGKMTVDIYGNRYPQESIDRLLTVEGVADVVNVHGPVPNSVAVRLARKSDLLFLALPVRMDGSSGGRISAKTYEYLATDRPILAAVPAGENRDFLVKRFNVWVVNPDDVHEMFVIIGKMALAKLAGQSLRRDRATDGNGLSYALRAADLGRVIESVVK